MKCLKSDSLRIEGGGWKIMEKSAQDWKCLGGDYLIDGKHPPRSQMPMCHCQSTVTDGQEEKVNLYF